MKKILPIVYVTKYALTKWIILFENIEWDSEFPAMITPASSWFPIHKPHWHELRDEAIEQAEKMRTSKIKAVNNQLKKLEKLNFRLQECQTRIP